MQQITPNLWFDSEAEEAARFYTSVFKDGKIGNIVNYSEVGQDIHGKPPGSVMTVEFEINGQKFLALNGGPIFKFNESVSFIVPCKDQVEIDYYWEKLSAGGDPEAQVCGWLKDKYGLSWQIAPAQMGEWLADAEKAKRVMAEMFQMKKIDLEKLKAA